MKSDDAKRSQAEARTDNAPSRNALHTLPQRVEASRPASSMIVVNVERGMVGGVECDAVDGRELCEKLGVNTRFNDWIPERIKQLNLVKNQHFDTFTGKSVKGRPPTEYRLTLVAAKKIAMAEHTDAGNAVRDYFLDRERISYEAPRQDLAMSRAEISDFVKDLIAQTVPAVVSAAVSAAVGAVQSLPSTVKIEAPSKVASVAPVSEQAEEVLPPKQTNERLLSAQKIIARLDECSVGHKDFFKYAKQAGFAYRVERSTTAHDGTQITIPEWLLTPAGLAYGENDGGLSKRAMFYPSRFVLLLGAINQRLKGHASISWTTPTDQWSLGF